MEHEKELRAMRLFNNARNPLQPIGDGLPLLSANRPTLDTNINYSNMLATQEGMTPASFEALWCRWEPLGHDGRMIIVKPKRLVCGDSNKINADIIFESYPKLFSEPPLFLPHLENQSVWGILTDVPGFIMYERKPLEVLVYKYQGGGVIFEGRARYSFAYLNPLAFVGSCSAM